MMRSCGRAVFVFVFVWGGDGCLLQVGVFLCLMVVGGVFYCCF